VTLVFGQRKVSNYPLNSGNKVKIIVVIAVPFYDANSSHNNYAQKGINLK
jgi:hypothetical protein